MDLSRLSKRTLAALEKLPADKRATAESIIARTQTPEARAQDSAVRALLDKEYQQTGRIAKIGENASRDDVENLRHFIKAARDERRARGLSLDQLATRSMLEPAVSASPEPAPG